MTLDPVFAPNQKSTYGNMNFELLGLVIANVSGVPYDEYVTTRILRPLGMAGSRFTMPPDELAAIPADIEYYWPFYMGVQNPTGGLYASSSDMSTWLRYILATYNARPLSAGNWFAPTSFSGSIDTFYGMPWEIFRLRTNAVVTDFKSTRPLTFVTKGGALPGYTSIMILIPEYALGITILIAGSSNLLSEIRETVISEIVRFADVAAMTELRSRYVGTYADEVSNSSITLSQSSQHGLTVTRWISNSIDTLSAFGNLYSSFGGGPSLLMHVLPTLLYSDESAHEKGEKWRLVPQSLGASEQAEDEQRRSPGSGRSGSDGVWTNFCISDWDIIAYAGKPMTELIFQNTKQKGQSSRHARCESVQLSGFRSTLYRKKEEKEEEKKEKEGRKEHSRSSSSSFSSSSRQQPMQQA